MSAAAAQVLTAHASLKAGAVVAELTTSRGRLELRFTPSLAKQVGADLGTLADPATRPHAQTGGHAPLLKPSGRIL